MVIGILVCGILMYATLDVVWTAVRRCRTRTAEARTVRALRAPTSAQAAALEEQAAAWADALETPQSMLWTKADQEWLESRRISLPT